MFHIRQNKDGPSASSGEGGTRKGPFFPCPVVQPKLTVSEPDDEFEKEADATAEKVMRMPAPGEGAQVEGSLFKPADFQRKQHEPEDELDKEILHRKERPDSLFSKTNDESAGNPGRETANYAASPPSSGQPLPDSALHFFEPRFGQDFSQVRVHTDEPAVRSAVAINALAYTSNNNIVFNQGQYSPDSESGKKLLAHELTHVVQQQNNPSGVVQRDLAVDPITPEAVGKTLTSAQIQGAIDWNNTVLGDPSEVSLVRDVLGIAAQPGVVDVGFITALVQYQANFGLTQDGLIGPGTAGRLADELKAEGVSLGAAADIPGTGKSAINDAERRMRLRSRVFNRFARLRHQGFIGPSGHPTGIVTARTGFPDPADPAFNNQIGLDYTGSDAADTRWIQFVFREMSALDPATRNRVFNTGSVTTTGGTHKYSQPSAIFWNVDTVPATHSMYYEAGGDHRRTPGSIEIIDQVIGFNGEADKFAGSFASRPAKVKFTEAFDSYLVVNDTKVMYHIRYNISFVFDTSVTPVDDVRGTYELLSAGPMGKLPSDRKKVLDADFPSNTVT
ncbi:MAG TPA: DUF4157 domain-containing protein [Puia sp.]|jgi:hypothetical protein|nr:DUF4157 domain-containing protein [Puia sp.]